MLTGMHTQKALSLLSAWLAEVGMSANPSKSKVVVFSCVPQQNQPWLTDQARQSKSHWYHHLKLDGFTLELTDQYVYLGVTLDTNLNWQAHMKQLLRKVANTSALICRLYSKPQHAPHPLASLRLVQSLLMPIIRYGIEFWYQLNPSQSSHNNFVDKLHTLIIRPLRMSCNLPINTHRLGVLVDFGLSSVHDLAQQSVYRFYQKYAGSQVHSQLKQPLNFTKSISSGTPLKPYHPSVTRVLQDAFYHDKIQPSAVLTDPRWMTVGSKARFVTEPALNLTLVKSQTVPALAQLPVVKSHVAHPITAQYATPINIIPPIDPSHLTEVGRLMTFWQWRDQWASLHPEHKRKTTAPLTRIKQQPGTAKLLHFITDKQVIQTLMRLRHGRAFTHDVRVRFEKPGLPSINPLCKFDTCETAGVKDSVEHLLQSCPRNNEARQALLTAWSQHCYGRYIRTISDLKLHLLLGELPCKYNAKYRNKFTSWYASLSTFITEVRESRPVTEECPAPL